MTDTKEIDLRRAIKALRKKLWLIVAAAIIFALFAGVLTAVFSTPVYSASVSLYVNNTLMGGEALGGITSSDLATSQRLVNTCIYIMKSNRVLGNASDKVKWDLSSNEILSMLSAEGVGETECFVVTVKHTDPQVAADVANALGIAAVEEIPKVIKGSSMSIIDNAVVPGAPMDSGIVGHILFWGMLGALATAFVVIVLEMMDTRIKDLSELEQLSSLAVLGVIPDFEEGGGYYAETVAANGALN